MQYTYEQAVDYLLNIPKFAKKTTKDNLLSLLKKLGDPQKKKPAIHVAGTNGKGSTCAYMNSILLKAGFHTGLFTSPHLVDLEERFRLDGEVVAREEFLCCFHLFKQAMDAHVKEGNAHLSFFEAVFVIGALIFSRAPIDYAIYETGLGGRLDATNVLIPRLTVITSIGRDHMQFLGDTIEQIAEEKAGIIKEGVPVVYLANTEASAVISRKAVEKCAKEIKLSKEFIKFLKKDQKHIDFCFNTRYIRYDSLTIDTCAEYQMENASLAILAIHELIPTVKSEVVREGIKAMKWSCRMEEIMDGVYIDGAHNEPAVMRLMETVKQNKAESALLFAVVQDKDYKKMIELLSKDNIFSKVIVTSVDEARSSNEERIKEQFLLEGQHNVCAKKKSKEAFQIGLAWKKEKENRMLYCAGSLYLAGELCKELKKGAL